MTRKGKKEDYKQKKNKLHVQLNIKLQNKLVILRTVGLAVHSLELQPKNICCEAESVYVRISVYCMTIKQSPPDMEIFYSYFINRPHAC